MKKILFLDFDGVLNNKDWYVKQAAAMKRKGQRHALDNPYNPVDDLDPENLRQLAEIARRVPDMKVVVSSSWRRGRTMAELREYLRPAFEPERVVGATGSHESRLRHVEITNWLETNCSPRDTIFLALDDDTFDMTPLGENFLHVHADRGLLPQHVEHVVRHFGEGQKPSDYRAL